jgi:hypothetical protein
MIDASSDYIREHAIRQIFLILLYFIYARRRLFFNFGQETKSTTRKRV